jgi:hypothetical protein
MKTWNVGDVVCDMHYGLPKKSWYPEQVPLETKDHIRTDVPDSSSILNALLSNMDAGRMVTNKMAVVVGYDGPWIVAAYSYDNRYFGMFKFCNKVEQSQTELYNSRKQ